MLLIFWIKLKKFNIDELVDIKPEDNTKTTLIFCDFTCDTLKFVWNVKWEQVR